MKASPLPRKTANLSESIHQQLSMYALAAGAAGVGMLALAQSSEAKIVYTPAHKQLPLNRVLNLDLNHDRISDFQFFLNSRHTSAGVLYSLIVQPGQPNQLSNRVVMAAGDLICAAALPKGARISSKNKFYLGPIEMFIRQVFSTGGTASYCPWRKISGKKQAYLGLEFSIKGKVHFAWARFGDIHPGHTPTAELTGYAYETIPNKPIIAGATKGPEDAEPTAAFSSQTPEPATLGALALGAPGLSIWRRKESAAAALPAN